MDHLCYLCLVFVMLPCLFTAALWSPAGLTSWLSFVMFYCVVVTFQCGILGQVWYLIVSIPTLSYLGRLLTLYIKTPKYRGQAHSWEDRRIEIIIPHIKPSL